MGGDAVTPCILALKNRDVAVRCGAANALGRLGDPRTVKPLLERLRDRNPGVRHGASGSLYQLTGQDLSDDEYESWEEWYERSYKPGI